MPLVAAHKIDISQGSTQIYNGLDVCLTAEAFLELNKLPKPGAIYDFSRALQAPVMEMTLRGFRVDPFAREQAIRTLRIRLERLSHIIDTVAEVVWDEIPPPSKASKYTKPKRLNPESTQQLQRFFYDNLGISPVTRWVAGDETRPMDRKALERIGDYFEARFIVSAILAYRDTVGQLEVLESQVDSDWRMRTSYNIGGTNEGRFSSSKSSIGTGRNMQNVEEDLRYIFIADPGHKLCGIDLEQSDSRQVGYMCGILFDDWSYLDACESGDLHTTVARLVWRDLPWTGDLKKDRKIADRLFYRHHSFRQTSKRLGHGVNFMGKARNMAQETKIPVKLVADFIEVYFDAFPCIPRWHTWTAGVLQSKRRLTSVYGRTRDFFDRPESEDTVKAALAFLAASPTADNLNLGMWRIWKHMPYVKLLAQLHDAVYFQFPETMNEREVVTKAQSLVEVRLTHGNRSFIVPTEAKVGYNWGPRYKSDEDGNKIDANPRGLDKLAA